MTHSCVWHVSFKRATWLIHVCNMTHSCVSCDSVTCVTWLIHMPKQIGARLTYMCDITYSYFWHDSFIYVRHDASIGVTCLIHVCATWLIHMGHMAHTPKDRWGTWLIHICDMAHSYMRRDSLTCATWLIHVWHDSFMCETWYTGWPRPTKCLKLHVIYRKRATNYRALLR